MANKELLTDDMDIRDTILSMDVGGNGDYYLSLKETKCGEVVRLDTRIAISGGNASLEVKLAIANLYRALNKTIYSDGYDYSHLQSNGPGRIEDAVDGEFDGTCTNCGSENITVTDKADICHDCKNVYT